MQQEQSLHYLLELTKQGVHTTESLITALWQYHIGYHLLVTGEHGLHLGLILTVTAGSHTGRGNELVSDTAKRRNHHYHIILL